MSIYNASVDHDMISIHEIQYSYTLNVLSEHIVPFLNHFTLYNIATCTELESKSICFIVAYLMKAYDFADQHIIICCNCNCNCNI